MGACGEGCAGGRTINKRSGDAGSRVKLRCGECRAVADAGRRCPCDRRRGLRDCEGLGGAPRVVRIGHRRRDRVVARVGRRGRRRAVACSIDAAVTIGKIR